MSATIFSMPKPQPHPWTARQPNPIDGGRIDGGEPVGARADDGTRPPPVQPAHGRVHQVPDAAAARRDLLERGAAEVARARRYERPLALISVTGRAEGVDNAVVEAALRDVLEGATRVGADIVVRTGPSALVCLLPETNLSGAMHLGARIQRTLRDLRLAGATGGVAARIGFSALTKTDRTFAAVLARAQAMLSDRPATQ